MKNFDQTKLTELLNAEKWDEAGRALEDYFRQDLTAEERGKAYVDLTMMHVAAQNSLNRRYLEVLENALAMAKDLQKQHKALEDEIDLTSARSQIQSS